MTGEDGGAPLSASLFLGKSLSKGPGATPVDSTDLDQGFEQVSNGACREDRWTAGSIAEL